MNATWSANASTSPSPTLRRPRQHSHTLLPEMLPHTSINGQQKIQGTWWSLRWTSIATGHALVQNSAMLTGTGARTGGVHKKMLSTHKRRKTTPDVLPLHTLMAGRDRLQSSSKNRAAQLCQIARPVTKSRALRGILRAPFCCDRPDLQAPGAPLEVAAVAQNAPHPNSQNSC